MNSLFPDICSTDLPACKTFYATLLGFETVFELDWYLQMRSPTNDSVQIAFVARDHESVPAGYSLMPQGIVVTVEMDDIGPVYDTARSLNIPIVQELKDEEWGQRHFMACDPNGLLIDLVQMIEPSENYAKHFQ